MIAALESDAFGERHGLDPRERDADDPSVQVRVGEARPPCASPGTWTSLDGGAVRSHARKALAEGIGPEVIRQVAVLAISTAGFRVAIAAFGWINEVLHAESGA